MKRIIDHRWLLVPATLVFVVAGCNDSTGPSTGAVQVSVTTTGVSPDANSYTVAVDGGIGHALAGNGTTTFTALSAGSHSVLLTGLAPNCAMATGVNPRAVTVVAGDTARVGFTVACAATSGTPRVGLWDYTQRITDPRGVSCADTGTFMLAPVGSGFAGWGEQAGGSSNGSGLGICNTTRELNFYPLPRPFWPIMSVMWDTLTNGSVAGTAVRFTTGWVVCQYTGALVEPLEDEMGGSVTCNPGIGTTNGTWHAQYHQPVGGVSISLPTPLPVLVPGTHLGWFDAVVTDTAGRRLFGRPVSWTSDDPAVATITTRISPYTVITAVSDGVTSIRAIVEGRSATAPVSVGPVRFAAILAGAGESWGLSTAGTLYRWPEVGLEFLGDSTVLPSPVAYWLTYTSASLGSLGEFYYNRRGLERVCGLTADGAAYCGATGDPISGAAVPQFSAVTAGFNHACGRTASGSGYCWGDNRYGELGDGSLTGGGPVPVAGGLRFTSLSAGLASTCGVAAGGAGYCWGVNDSGQLGDGTVMNRSTPSPVAGGLAFTSVSAGRYHTCGVTVSGAAYCWGWNGSANLGDGSTTDRLTPVAVLGALTFASVSVSSGQLRDPDFDPPPPVAYSCGVTTTNAAWCWGDNTFGQLGTGAPASASAPVPVTGRLSFATVSAGPDHACGLTTTGIAYCWGNNATGALGNRSSAWSLVPVRVGGQP